MLLWESGTDIFVQDYVLTGYIAEVINTVSNLTYRTPFLLSHPLSSTSSYFAQKCPDHVIRLSSSSRDLKKVKEKELSTNSNT